MEEPEPNASAGIEDALADKNYRLARIVSTYRTETGNAEKENENWKRGLQEMSPLQIAQSAFEKIYQVEMPVELTACFRRPIWLLPVKRRKKNEDISYTIEESYLDRRSGRSGFYGEPLHSAGIFAISGCYGAGKSTLLDALCLALYDKAPRFATSVESVNLADVGDNQINQSDVRNLLRRGTSDGYAEVDFLGIDGRRYRSRWSVRRTRNKINGSLQPQTLEVKELDTEKEFQGTKKELLIQLVELVGLTYEQFTRTVLLAQNDFCYISEIKRAAKAELLEKLTGTGVYSRISQEVYAGIRRHKRR